MIVYHPTQFLDISKTLVLRRDIAAWASEYFKICTNKCLTNFKLFTNKRFINYLSQNIYLQKFLNISIVLRRDIAGRFLFVYRTDVN